MARRPDERFRPFRAPRRRCLNSVERLEVRQLLSASPLPAPPSAAPVAVWVASVPPAGTADTWHFDRSVTEFHAASGQAVQPFIPAQSSPEVKAFGAAQPADLPRARGAELQPIKDLFAPTATLSRFDAILPDSPRGSDATFNRFVLFMSDGWQVAQFGQMPGPEGTSPDPHIRYFELVHESWVESRLAALTPDSVHSADNDAVMVGGARSGERHASASLVLFGQSAESDTVFIGRDRSIGDVQRGIVPADGDGSESADNAAERAIVGYLVAFDEVALGWGVDAVSAVARPLESGDRGAVTSLMHELLTPRLTYDAEALSVALTDVVAQAEELGFGLLGMLTDPVASGEAALVTGVVGMGLVYRHWRGGQRREQLEEQELLSARFIHGPASLRLGRRSSP